MTADQELIIAVQDRAHELAVSGRHTEAQKLYAAAERIRVLGEEVDAVRRVEDDEDDDHHVEERLLREREAARAATDAARRG